MSISVCFTLRQTVAVWGAMALWRYGETWGQIAYKTKMHDPCQGTWVNGPPDPTSSTHTHGLRHAAAMSYCNSIRNRIHLALAHAFRYANRQNIPVGLLSRMAKRFYVLWRPPHQSHVHAHAHAHAHSTSALLAPPSWFRTHWLTLKIHFNVEIIIALVVFPVPSTQFPARDWTEWAVSWGALSLSWHFVWHLAVEIKCVQATSTAEHNITERQEHTLSEKDTAKGTESGVCDLVSFLIHIIRLTMPNVMHFFL